MVHGLVDAAIADLTSADHRSEVRQAACALLYNTTLTLSIGDDDLPDVAVSMICAVLEGIAHESDGTIKLRRMMVAGRIIKPANDFKTREAAKRLVSDLGFVEALSEVSCSNVEHPEKDKSKRLAAELLSIIQE